MTVIKPLRSCAVAILAVLCLSGCFAGRQPLISADKADVPFADGAKFVSFTNCASQGGQLLGCKGYKRNGSGTLSLDNGAYTVHPDPGTVPVVPGLPAAGPDMTILIKNVGGELFVAQLPLTDDTLGPSIKYIYEMLRITGHTAYVYAVLCEQNGDQAYVKSGALASISTELMLPTCEANSLAGLAKIFKDRLDNGAVPDQKLEIHGKG